MAIGSTAIDFGAAPGAWEASVTVTGQSAILAGSSAEAFVMGDSTADHNADEHSLAPSLFKLTCGSVVAGTGFTITARAESPLTGQWAVRWVWA